MLFDYLSEVSILDNFSSNKGCLIMNQYECKLFPEDVSFQMYIEESVDDCEDIVGEIILHRLKQEVIEFLETLSQRAKLREELRYPLKVYNDITCSHVVLVSKRTERIRQQQGAFIYPAFFEIEGSLEDLKMKINFSIEEKSAKILSIKTDRIKIPSDKKQEIREHLALVGITDSFIFPDIKNTSKSMLK